MSSIIPIEFMLEVETSADDIARCTLIISVDDMAAETFAVCTTGSESVAKTIMLRKLVELFADFASRDKNIFPSDPFSDHEVEKIIEEGEGNG